MVEGVPRPVASPRRAMLAKVHMAVKALGIAEEDYRALLGRVTGKASAKDCDNGELSAVVAEMGRLGFRSTAQALPRRQRATHPIARKARAMWISLHQLGAIDDPSEKALETFAKRQLGVDRLQWADQRHSGPLIEALKGMAERHGWSQRASSRLPTEARLRQIKANLATALAAKLEAAGGNSLGIILGDRSDATMAQIEAKIAELAARLRAARAAAR